LLIEEADEEVNANFDTFIKLYNLIGGHKVTLFIAGLIVFQKYFDMYT
jgi:hypothetical protein